MATLDEFEPQFCQIESQGDVTVVVVDRARLSEEDNITQWGQELIDLVEQYGCHRLVVSLERVVYLSSAALGKLIMLHRRLHRHSGRLVLCGLVDTVSDIFATGRLDQYFTIVPDVPGGVAAVQQG